MKKTNELERRYRTCEVRASGGGGRASGHPLTWGDVYSVGEFDERVMRGALDDVIDDPGIAALWNHDSSNVLGRQGAGTLRVSQDARGVMVDFDMPKSAHREREALERGDVFRMSWGFRVGEGNDSWEMRDGRELRTIHKVEQVFDFSPVTFPASPFTDVAMRSRDAWRCSGKGCREKRGASLAKAMNAAMEKMGDFAPTLAELGSAAGISASTVGQILAGEIKCPPLDRIEAFGELLTSTSSTALIIAAEEDGCEYDSVQRHGRGLSVVAAGRRLRLAGADMSPPNEIRRRRRHRRNGRLTVKEAKRILDIATQEPSIEAPSVRHDNRTLHDIYFDSRRTSLHEAGHAVVFHITGPRCRCRRAHLGRGRVSRSGGDQRHQLDGGDRLRRNLQSEVGEEGQGGHHRG